MKHLCLILISGMLSFANAQEGLSIAVGGGMNYLQLKPFQTFVDSYNQQFTSTLNRPLKYNPFGLEYDVALNYSIASFYSGLRVGTSKSWTSYASFAEGDRNFSFRSYYFDVVAGIRIGKIIPYFTMTINSLNINSYFEFSNGIKSYGSDHGLSGVYTSWKMQGCLGLRYEEKMDVFGYFVDVLVPVNAKKYLGGTFDKQTNSTDAPYFPQENSNYGSLDTELAMPQTYRNARLNVGIVYYFKH